MLYRSIPIHVAPAAPAAARARALPVAEPRLCGEPAQLGRLLAALEPAVWAELGGRVPAGAWLRGLSVDDDEAVVSLAPGLDGRGADVAQAAFETLKRLLHDTDIYVGAARH